MTPEKNIFTECQEGRIDAETFLQFLAGYGTFWHYCHAKGRLDTSQLETVERNMIAYAKQHNMRLQFREMAFRLTDDMQ
jgi:hypothetical protein